MVSKKELFEKLLELVGKTVEVGINSSGKKIIGKITNAMFDSFIVESANDKHIVSFNDLAFVNEL